MLCGEAGAPPVCSRCLSKTAASKEICFFAVGMAMRGGAAEGGGEGLGDSLGDGLGDARWRGLASWSPPSSSLLPRLNS